MRTQLIISVTMALLLLGCSYDDDEECYHAPSYCAFDSPVAGVVRVRVSNPEGRDSIPVTFYEGTVESGRVLATLVVTSERGEIVLANATIAARARYTRVMEGELSNVFAVDGGTLAAKANEYCEGVCYEEGTLELDLRLGW